MKRIIALLMCAAMLLCASACGKNVKDKAEAFTMTQLDRGFGTLEFYRNIKEE